MSSPAVPATRVNPRTVGVRPRRDSGTGLPEAGDESRRGGKVGGGRDKGSKERKGGDDDDDEGPGLKEVDSDDPDYVGEGDELTRDAYHKDSLPPGVDPALFEPNAMRDGLGYTGDYKYVMRGVFLTGITTASNPGRDRWLRVLGITHMLVLGAFDNVAISKCVTLRVATQDVASFDLYSHLFRIVTFIQSARDEGGIVIVDRHGDAEAAAAFIAYAMTLGLNYDDSQHFLIRHVREIHLNYGFEAQLRIFERLPGIATGRIREGDMYDLFPDLRPARVVLEEQLREELRDKRFTIEEAPRAPIKAAIPAGFEIKIKEEPKEEDDSDGGGVGGGGAGESKAGDKAAVVKKEAAEKKSEPAMDPSKAWAEYFDETELKMYYYNSVTGEMTWERPAEMETKSKAPAKEDKSAVKLKTEAEIQHKIAKAKAARKAKIQKKYEILHSSVDTGFKSKKTKPKETTLQRKERLANERERAIRLAEAHKYYKAFVQTEEITVCNSRNPVRRVQFCRMPGRLITTDFDGDAKLHICENGTLIAHLATGPTESTHGSWVLGLTTYRPPGSKVREDLITASFNGDTKIWKDPFATNALTVSGLDNHPVLIQHIATALDFEKAPTSKPLSHLCVSVAVSPDGQAIYVVQEDGTVKLYGLPTTYPATRLKGLSIPLIPPIQNYSYQGAYRALHHRYDRSGQPITVPISKIYITRDGRSIITAGLEGAISIWDLEFRHVMTMPLEFKPTRFVPTNTPYATSGRKIVLTPKEKAKRTAQIKLQRKEEWDHGAVTDFQVSTDQTRLVASYMRGQVIVWDLKSGKQVWRKRIMTGIIDTEAKRAMDAAIAEKRATQMAKKAGGVVIPTMPVVPQESDDAGNIVYGPAMLQDETDRDTVRSSYRASIGPAQSSRSVSTIGTEITEPESARKTLAKSAVVVSGIALSPDFKYIALCTADAWAQLLNAKSGRIICATETAAECTDIDIDQEGKKIGVSMTNGKVALYEVQEQRIDLGCCKCTIM